MTRDEILAMPAGAEMDAMVAEKVIGFAGPIGYWGPTKPKGTHLDYDCYGMNQEAAQEAHMLHWGRGGGIGLCRWQEGWGPLCVDEYSTDISAAWEVVEKLQETHRELVLVCSYGQFMLGEPPPCDSYAALEIGAKKWRLPPSADTAPLAICRAALLATLEPA